MLIPRRAVPGATEERRAAGRAARTLVPRRSQALVVTDDRPDPVAIIEASNEGRVPALVPVRHGRMGVSAFAFYRGSAAIMAGDLARGPSTSLRVQLCGDAHLANFGLYATPDRNLIFDLNDFDETAKGPFEWDVKRLAASAVLCGRQNGHTARQAREAGVAAAAAYRGHINRLAATRR